MEWSVRNQNERSELTHHGVLGMKWGVRRYQPYPKGKHGTFLGQSRDEDIIVSKGTKAYRVSSEASLGETGQTYVSLDDMIGHIDYISITASNDLPGVALDVTASNKNDGRAYSLRLKLTEDLIMPSYQQTMDSFIKMVDEYGGAKKVAKDLWAPQPGNIPYENQLLKERGKEFIKGCKNFNVDELRDKAYTNFATTLFRDTKARAMFFDDLKSKGYNAIVDEADKQYGNGMTESPTIIFDKSESLKLEKAKPLTKEDYSYMRDLYFTGPDLDYIREQNPNASKEWDKYVEDKYKRESK